jgi:hypothetical protein
MTQFRQGDVLLTARNAVASTFGLTGAEYSPTQET